MKSAAVLASLCFIVGCGGGGGGDGTGGNGGAGGSGGDLTSAPADLTSSASDLATASTDMAGGSGLCCGQPGDPGNELGVGKYCNGFSDCTGMASLCANIGDPQLHFCTMVCQMGGNCGTGAACQCQNGQCGCLPNSCLTMPSTC